MVAGHKGARLPNPLLTAIEVPGVSTVAVLRVCQPRDASGVGDPGGAV